MPTPLAQVQSDYLAIQFAPPPPLNPATVASYLPLDPPVVISSIEAEAYTTNVVNPVIREYQGAFGTVPDQAGQAYWVHQFGVNGVPLSDISTIFANSAQFGSLYGGANATTPANTTLVTAMYQNVLQRAPDAAGLAFWIGTGDTAAQLLQAFTQSGEAINLFAPHIVEYQNLEAAGTPPVPPTSLFTVVATGFTLTPNIDSPTQGFTTGSGATATAANSVFNALPVVETSGLGVNTLNTGDNLLATGAAAGATTLNFTTSPVTVGANPPYALGVTTTGVSTLNISNQVGGAYRHLRQPSRHHDSGLPRQHHWPHDGGQHQFGKFGSARRGRDLAEHGIDQLHQQRRLASKFHRRYCCGGSLGRCGCN